MDDIKIGMILQSYADAENNEGCEYCNESHPDYDSISGIHTDGQTHYLEMEVDDGWNEDDGRSWHYKYIDMNYCFNCGRDLSKPLSLTLRNLGIK